MKKKVSEHEAKCGQHLQPSHPVNVPQVDGHPVLGQACPRLHQGQLEDHLRPWPLKPMEAAVELGQYSLRLDIQLTHQVEVGEDEQAHEGQLGEDDRPYDGAGTEVQENVRLKLKGEKQRQKEDIREAFYLRLALQEAGHDPSQRPMQTDYFWRDVINSDKTQTRALSFAKFLPKGPGKPRLCILKLVTVVHRQKVGLLNEQHRDDDQLAK